MAIIGVNLTLAWRLKPQLHRLAPAYAGSKLFILGQSAQADFGFVGAISNRQRLS